MPAEMKNLTIKGTTFEVVDDAARNDIIGVKSELLDNNCVDIISRMEKKTVTRNGVTYDWNGEYFTVNGTATNTAYMDFFSSPGTLPFGLKPGGTYYIKYASNNVQFRMFPYVNNELQDSYVFNLYADGKVTIPEGISGCILRLSVAKGKTIENAIVYPPKMLSAPSNADLNAQNFKNVIGFGAKGDGVSDDTVFLQQALNECGTILLPKGKYIITSPLVFYSDTHIIMETGAEIILTSNSEFCVIRSYNTANDVAYNGVKNVIIEGGTINANGQNRKECSCLGMAHCDNIKIKDITFIGQNAGMHAVDMAACRNVTFDSCIFKDLFTTSSQGCCLQLDVAEKRGAYPYIMFEIGSNFYDKTGCKSISIINCRFYLNGYSPAIGNHNSGEHSDIIIYGNMIYGPGKDVSTLSRGVIALDIDSSYSPDVNHTKRMMIHHNIISDCYYVLCIGTENDGQIYVRDNILYNINEISKYNSNSVIMLNNIEI